MTCFYHQAELLSFGFKRIGKNVKISRFTYFYEVENISIGNNVRIDDFCILSGLITLGNNIHIAAGCFLFGGEAGIELHDFVGISSRTAIYAISDDFSGSTLTGPTIPSKFRRLTQKKVVLEKHVLVGTHSVILPGVIIEEGASVGALSLVNESLPTWKICAGRPAKPVSDRMTDILKLEKEYLEECE